MEAYVQTVVGVIISVVLFLIGYRQTVGARRERVRTANVDIERILLRRIVLESYTPTVEEISRLIDGKARDYRVNATEMLSESQLLNTLFTRILESDFLTPQQRAEVAARVSPATEKAQAVAVSEARVLELPSAGERVGARTIVPLLAIAGSVLGAVVSAAVAATESDVVFLWPGLVAFGGSLVVIVTIAMAYRFRELQEEPGRGAALTSALDFEREVWRVLQKIGALPATGARETGYDFATEVAGKKVLVAVKAWFRRPPMALLRVALADLRQAVQTQGADEAILVIPTPLEFPTPSLESPGLRVMTLRQLRDYVAQSTP